MTQRNVYKPLNEQFNFVDLSESNQWFTARYVGRQAIEKFPDREPVFVFDVYASGTSETKGLPDEVALSNMIKGGAMRTLFPSNQTILECMAKVEKPETKLILLHFLGKKSLQGGNKFNQWAVYELDLNQESLPF
jgi:hypothetical protein